MKAVAGFPQTKEVKVIEQDAPCPTEPDHVKVCMLEIGICGTDKEICAFEYVTPPEGSASALCSDPWWLERAR